ncbi:MAG: CTP synthase [Nitrospirae bacterium RIFCSPLOW2_12_42_9]|nr:MAG: CTP synthase [Nitrospirae bacterium RIFCSPLOW2_12_42_9]HBI23818.1 CTP synthetase [Nitrospiraceae bacterium]
MTTDKNTPKFIFITGGVVSSLGKGIASASIGSLLESEGLKVTFLKFDPYINVDPGTMNPFQHGEVFVTEDGSETDLDLGHYERFTSVVTSRKNNYTTGKIYYNVISKERRGEYLGGTVQMVPHITDEIKQCILDAANNMDVIIVEIGGTVGDIEGLPYLEAIRQFRFDMGVDKTLSIHLTLIPYIKTADEIKTKPTQHSVNKMREIGIQPDILVCRTDRTIPPEVKRKIALFCNVDPESVIIARDVESIYEVPLMLHEDGLDRMILKKLNIQAKGSDLKIWEDVAEKIKHPEGKVKIAVVGKYVHLKDSYKSLCEALAHGGIANNVEVDIQWIDAEEVEKRGAGPFLSDVHGVLIPGGFGSRGIEGKIQAIRFARENRVPFFGICLGMQCAVIEFARNVAGLEKANSTEFDGNTPYPVIHIMPGQEGVEKGGTMRLGAYPCILMPNSLAYNAYKSGKISERHRHRYEFNNNHRDMLIKNGMVISGLYPQQDLVEIIELKEHPWFLASQFHPEFKSKPTSPHPLFTSFIEAAAKRSKGI